MVITTERKHLDISILILMSNNRYIINVIKLVVMVMTLVMN